MCGACFCRDGVSGNLGFGALTKHRLHILMYEHYQGYESRSFAGVAAGEIVRVYRSLKGLSQNWNPGDPLRQAGRGYNVPSSSPCVLSHLSKVWKAQEVKTFEVRCAPSSSCTVYMCLLQSKWPPAYMSLTILL